MNDRFQRRRQVGSVRREYFESAFRLRFNREVRAGDPVVRFDILTGDQLFVDRVSYHFTQPKVGQGFVFRTDRIPGIGDEQYYIKRLVGTAGDVMEIKEPARYRNGKPITGAESFGFNERQEGSYRGYYDAVRGQNLRSNLEYLLPGEKVTVPPD